MAEKKVRTEIQTQTEVPEDNGTRFPVKCESERTVGVPRHNRTVRPPSTTLGRPGEVVEGVEDRPVLSRMDPPPES